jgi:LEA14-like dessication related protein
MLGPGCAVSRYGIRAPSLSLVDVRPMPGGALEQRLELDLVVQNPNDFDVEIDGMRLQLDLNGLRLGRAVSNQTLSLPRLDEARMTLQASVTLLDVARQLLTLDSAQQSLDYRLSGDIYVAEPRSTRVAFDDSGEVLPTPR